MHVSAKLPPAASLSHRDRDALPRSTPGFALLNRLLNLQPWVYLGARIYLQQVLRERRWCCARSGARRRDPSRCRRRVVVRHVWQDRSHGTRDGGAIGAIHSAPICEDRRCSLADIDTGEHDPVWNWVAV